MKVPAVKLSYPELTCKLTQIIRSANFLDVHRGEGKCILGSHSRCGPEGSPARSRGLSSRELVRSLPQLIWANLHSPKLTQWFKPLYQSLSTQLQLLLLWRRHKPRQSSKLSWLLLWLRLSERLRLSRRMLLLQPRQSWKLFNLVPYTMFWLTTDRFIKRSSKMTTTSSHTTDAIEIPRNDVSLLIMNIVDWPHFSWSRERCYLLCHGAVDRAQIELGD